MKKLIKPPERVYLRDKIPYCKECGAELPEDSSFCPECGTDQTAVTEETEGPEKTETKSTSKGRKGGDTELGMEENVEGALCYILTWITGIVFLLLEKENRFVRFHAMQSIITFLPLTIVGYLFRMMTTPYYGWGFSALWFLSSLIWLAIFGLWLFLMYKAYQGERFKVPIAGNIAENNI